MVTSTEREQKLDGSSQLDGRSYRIAFSDGDVDVEDDDPGLDPASDSDGLAGIAQDGSDADGARVGPADRQDDLIAGKGGQGGEIVDGDPCTNQTRSISGKFHGWVAG